MHTDVPGLLFVPDFLSSEECSHMVNESLQVKKAMDSVFNQNNAGNQTSIPQPEFAKDEQHNLAQTAEFHRVEFNSAQGKALKCEIFPSYGGQGHALVYFRGNDNLPEFIEHALPKVIALLETHNLLTDDLKNQWRLTMNFYNAMDGKIAGFPFHVDIPANGVMTMILNVEREATFEITNEEVTNAITLPMGALLLLSGPSRYQWKHRVLPVTTDATVDQVARRISLVLGIK